MREGEKRTQLASCFAQASASLASGDDTTHNAHMHTQHTQHTQQGKINEKQGTGDSVNSLPCVPHPRFLVSSPRYPESSSQMVKATAPIEVTCALLAQAFSLSRISSSLFSGPCPAELKLLYPHSIACSTFSLSSQMTRLRHGKRFDGQLVTHSFFSSPKREKGERENEREKEREKLCNRENRLRGPEERKRRLLNVLRYSFHLKVN